MKKILIPIDFSENAYKALEAAKVIASKYNSELLVMHAYKPYYANIGAADGGIITAVGSPDALALTAELEEEFKRKLEQVEADLIHEGYTVHSLWEFGSVKTAVEQVVATHHPDLVVVGRTGEGGFLDKLIGTSATSIALHTPCPVLVIPPQSSPTSFREIVYATQLEYDENSNLAQVLSFARTMGANIQFLKVNSKSQMDIQPDSQFLADIRTTFGLPADLFVTRDAKHVLDGIEDYCDEVEADLIVVSSRERGFLEEYLINPGLTKKLIIDTHLPLLVYHLK
ncbi:universal stress protein [Dyadobacter tibetensis]|uniref:universal stress protein n=1 Tax=Dyadobacter tibetensis TaxID=1211851 RepID=UPI000470339E|nr:universal stress protein [Dyadobacter tibetensis]